jgi:signal transduction histidine kinase
MSWTDAIEDRWGGRGGTTRLGLRLIGLGFFTYVLIKSGAFTGPRWVAVGTGAAIAAALVLLMMRAWRPFDRWALVLTTLLMALGVVLNPSIDYLGSVFFVLGGIILVGQPEVPVRLGVSITAALGIGLVVRAVLANPEWTVLLSTLFGVVAVVLFGANRRQRVLRLRETARATELEQRSRIARDLHDVLAHSLGGLVVQLDAASAELEKGQTAEAAARLSASRQLAVDGLREARTAVEELRTGAERVVADDPTDLVDALERIVRGPVGLQLAAELDVVGDRRLVSAATAHALTAATREALTNANKHAPGAQVSVTVLFAPATVRLEVVNGLVTPNAGVDELAETGGGSGLAGCRERMKSVGGRLGAGREGQRWVVSAECPTPALRASSAERGTSAEGDSMATPVRGRGAQREPRR